MSRESLRTWIQPAVIVLIAGLIFGAVRASRELGWIDPEHIARWLESVSRLWWGPLAFIGLFAIFNTLGLPGTILTLTAGIVWGWWIGGLWVLVASVIGTLFPYFIARRGSAWIERRIRSRYGKLMQKLRSKGFMTLLLMRLTPFFPYNVLNYASGLAGIRLRDYVLSSLIGRIPGTFVYTYLASAIVAGAISRTDVALRVGTAGLLLATLAFGTRLLARRFRDIGGDSA